MKCRKFYKYIFYFLLDVAITNAFILQKGYREDAPFSSITEFRLKLASELTGDYCSRRRAGRSGGVVRSLPLRHFPTTISESNLSKNISEHAAPGVTARANTAGTPHGTAPSVRCGFVTRESRAQTMPNTSLNCSKCNLYSMIAYVAIYLWQLSTTALYGFATLIYNFLGQRAYQLNNYSSHQRNLYCYRL